MDSSEHLPNSDEYGELPFSEQLIVWAVRFWVQALKNETNVQSELRTAFKLARAPDGHPALDDLMTIITVSAQQRIDIRCTKCSSISPDEERIIGAIAAWQHDYDESHINPYLSAWLPKAAQRVAQTPIKQLSCALSKAGLRLRLRKSVKVEAARTISEVNGENYIGPRH